MRSRIVFRAVLIAACISLSAACLRAETASREVTHETEEALLAEDWSNVAELLADVDVNTASPILRLIKGHACLALNKNNESYCLFLSAVSDSGLAQYGEWAMALADQNDTKAIAHYFKGDAFARKNDWTRAIASFDHALSRNPRHELSLNARGVVNAQMKNVSRAKRDFTEAAKVARSPLADAHANIGALWIQRKEGAKGAREAFDRALKISPAFALALHGKGCIELISRQFAEAGHDLKSADNEGMCFGLFLFENQARYAAYATDTKPEELLAEIADPGMSLRRSIRADQLISTTANNLSAAGKIREMTWLPFNQHFANFRANRAVEGLEQISRQFGQAGIQDFATRYPDLAPQGLRESERVREWNQDYGGAKVNIEIGKMGGTQLIGQGLRSASIPITAAGVGIAGTAIQADSWRNFHKETLPSVISTFESMPSVSSMRSSTFEPSGVYAGMKIQDGNWPFKALYGLAYGMESSPSSSH